MTILYYSPGACSLSCHIVLEEIGTPYELVLVSAADGGTRSAEHLALNPKGRVPVLAVNGEVLTETTAIMTYLALAHPEKALLPKNPMVAARVYEWLNYLSGHVHAATFRQMTRPHKFTVDEKAYDSVRESGRLQVQEACDFIESRMQGKHWSIGEDYTIADALLVTVFRWFKRREEQDFLKNCPSWTAHAKRMEARPAVQRALAREEITLWT